MLIGSSCEPRYGWDREDSARQVRQGMVARRSPGMNKSELRRRIEPTSGGPSLLLSLSFPQADLGSSWFVVPGYQHDFKGPKYIRKMLADFYAILGNLVCSRASMSNLRDRGGRRFIR